MGSPGDETGLCDVRLQRSVAIDRFRRAATVERQILTPRDAPSSFAAVATSPVGLRLPARDIDAFEIRICSRSQITHHTGLANHRGNRGR
jgi:hypothetical protein